MPIVVLPYTPRSQFSAFHARQQRWSCLVVHRRGGKTVALINDLIRAALQCPLQSPRFAYVAPTYSQAKDVAWNYLKRFTDPIPGRIVSEAELHVTLPGDKRVRLYGADNYDRMRGLYFDGVGIDEPADMDPAAWYDVIRPALSDRKGWAVWVGTPKGRDAFYRLWKEATGSKDWFTMRLPASESGLIDAAELASAKLSMRAVEGAYEREYECSFETPVHGSIYGEAINRARQEKRILDYEWDRSCPVYSAWDLGWADSTSVWLWQMVGRDIHWIWHTRQARRTAAEMAQLLAELNMPIAAHYLPHDSVAKDAGSGMSYKDALAKAGLVNLCVVPRTTNIWAGINSLRDILSRSWFRATPCEKGIEALEAYHTKDTTGGEVVVKEPVHDWSSHDADAARMVAESLELGLHGSVAARAVMNALPRYPDGSLVDVEIVRQVRNDRRKGQAKSNISR